MYDRIINLDEVLRRKSVFLFGPRQTGKSTFLKKTYKDALYINLLSKKDFDNFSLHAEALPSEIELFQRKNKSNIVIIDEVQKLPRLLDEVHHQIEENKNLRFILTGSSARKLKREGANLLGGRASWRSMLPLVYPELKTQMNTTRDLEKRLLVGGLPSIYNSENPSADYDDYIQLYLTEEIKAEGFVRNYEAFHRFLLTSALVNAKEVVFSSVANDAQIPPRTVFDYFQLLEDTLIGFMLPGFTETPSRKAISISKFYLFDTGLVNALLNRTHLRAGTPEFGDLFEHFVISEVRAFISYTGSKAQMMYWRTTSKFEVDLILKSANKILAIEIKAREHVAQKDYKGLSAFAEDHPKAIKMVVTLGGSHRIEKLATGEKIEIIPVFDFLKILWSGDLF